MLKQALRNPIIRAIIQIVGCVAMAGPTFGAGCAALSGALTLAAGGSVVDALKAFAFSFAPDRTRHAAPTRSRASRRRSSTTR